MGGSWDIDLKVQQNKESKIKNLDLTGLQHSESLTTSKLMSDHLPNTLLCEYQAAGTVVVYR